MVSRKQHVLSICALLCVAAGAVFGADAAATGKKYYPDDPLWREPAPRPVQEVVVRKIDDIYDFLDNTYVTPRREGKIAKRGPSPAGDVNTLGEVPDSGWYQNRHTMRRMSPAELERGPGNSTPPSPNGLWQVIGAKSDGVTPGFIIEDGRKNRYLLKLDPPRYQEMSSAADVIGSKFFYALGYNTPENYVIRFRQENLAIKDGLTWKDANGKSRPLTARALDEMLKPQPKGSDGTYRALASRWVPGKVVGPFSYRGVRGDDPNDTVPHEDRRMLRGLAVFCSWLNHHDTRSINSMDTIVVEGGHQYIKHYLIDFGSILGSAGYGPKEPWSGHEFTIEGKSAAVQMMTFGFYPPRWVRADYPKLTGVGVFDSWSFEPTEWKSNYPNPAFLMMDRQDAFWAAKQVALFTDDEIRTIVKTGEYSDPRAADWIVDCLIKRRDKIVQAWFSQVLALDKFRVADGNLVFDDLSVAGGSGSPGAYQVRWSTFDNDQGRLTPLVNSAGKKIPLAAAGAEYLAATVAGGSAGQEGKAITVYLRRSASSFDVVGVDR